MKIIKFVCLVVLFASCKKHNDPPPNNNEVKATVLLTSGNTVTINATAAKAIMGCGLWAGGTYVDGTNASDAAVYITVYASGLSCISSPGTYSFTCEYRPNVSSQSTAIYVNNGVSNPGSITFTTVNSHNMEGYFNAVCRYNTDSVIVTGTFKADHLN